MNKLTAFLLIIGICLTVSIVIKAAIEITSNSQPIHHITPTLNNVSMSRVRMIVLDTGTYKADDMWSAVEAFEKNKALVYASFSSGLLGSIQDSTLYISHIRKSIKRK